MIRSLVDAGADVTSRAMRVGPRDCRGVERHGVAMIRLLVDAKLMNKQAEEVDRADVATRYGE